MNVSSMPDAPAPGKIITFYSYKGGTGRSMALANVAWILAANRKRVFVIDWDLEAPGLHRYFRPFLIDKELASSNGLIDVVHAYVDETVEQLSEDDRALADPEAVKAWVDSFSDITRQAISLDFKFAGGGYIDFLPAGRQIAAYAERVNTFNWHAFYQRFGGGEFLDAVKRRLRGQYDYILIDSRTGVSDTSGISTVQMPDILAVCFTYNNQSIAGAAAIAESVRQARSGGQAEPIQIFPIPTRVEQSERTKLKVRQNYARHRFASLINHIPEDRRQLYWSQVEIPYIPFHAYEETLAALTDDPSDEKLILMAMRRITRHLTGNTVTGYEPNVKAELLQAILKEFAESHLPPGSVLEPMADEMTVQEAVAPLDAVAQANQQMASLNQVDALGARKLWQRLVVIREGSTGMLLSSWPVEVRSLPEEQQRIAAAFCQAGLLRRYEAHGADLVEIAHDALLRRWQSLHNWVKEDRAFLEWRAQLTETRQRWENNAQQSRHLLTGPVLENGASWVKSRRADLTDPDLDFFDRSKRRAKHNSRVFGIGLTMLTFGITVVLGSYAYYQRSQAIAAELRLDKAKAEAREIAVLAGTDYQSVRMPVPITDANYPADSASSAAGGRPVVVAPPTAGKEATLHGQLEAERRSRIELTYFAKASDPPSTGPELSKLGYKITLGAAPLPLATNTVWFGCASPLSSADVHLLARLLMHEGVALRKLELFAGSLADVSMVHVGASKINLRLPPLTNADVEAFDLEAACRKRGNRAMH